VRLTRASVRTGAIALAVGTLAASALLTAPGTQAAPPATVLTAPSPQGGDPIYGGSSRCSIGFNVRDGSNVYYFLTSGRCGNIAATWYADSARTVVLGTTVATSFPGNDYALVKYASGITPRGTVNLFDGTSRDITMAANAFVGESVCTSSATTPHVRCGAVTAINVTVNYAEGTVTGLIRTNICAEGGGPAGPLFDGAKAIGLYSGGSGTCSTGGTSYFQPVTEPLAVYGVSVY